MLGHLVRISFFEKEPSIFFTTVLTILYAGKFPEMNSIRSIQFSISVKDNFQQIFDERAIVIRLGLPVLRNFAQCVVVAVFGLFDDFLQADVLADLIAASVQQ